MEVKNILALAARSSKPQDEFVTENLSDEIQAALAEAIADEKKTTAKAAAMEIIQLLKKVRDKENAVVEEIRSLRRKENELKAFLAKLKDARDYANRSSNYMPLYLACGNTVSYSIRLQHADLLVVKPAQETPAA